MEDQSVINTGLRGVVVASTKISDVDGDTGKLVYRGYLAKDLAGKATFEEIAHLLLFEKLPDEKELESFQTSLWDHARLPEGAMECLRHFPMNAHPMDMLQSIVALLAAYDEKIKGESLEDFRSMGIRLLAQMPSVIASFHRLRSGKEPVFPISELSHAGNFLFMLTGQKPDAEVARFLDTALLLHAEHSFNASTFTARQVASTRAHLYACISAAMGSLSGELHGGANARVMEMLLEIGSVDAVDAYVENILNEGRKIMGLGHAVYRVDDPRAHILAPMSREMGIKTGEPRWYDISRKLEEKGKAAFKERKKTAIYVNVDFYSASLYHAMGIPVDLFTPVFAMARVAGWAAHVMEERFAGAAEKPVLYRPESEYIGEYCGPEECSFIPMENR
ncbi:MAG: citrate (Si)-synthase [Proteobacteria bacterium]|nr:citrate (Si)-synthase [Pseudomonadota bacterium]